jgi:hypothetical protein
MEVRMPIGFDDPVTTLAANITPIATPSGRRCAKCPRRA